MDLVVVYKSNTESYIDLIKALAKESFNPVALESPDSDAVYVPRGGYMKGARDYVYIAVPKDEKLGAVSFLRKWDQLHQSNVDNITKDLGKQFGFSILIILPFALLLILIGELEILPILFGPWLALFVIIANAENLKKLFTKNKKEF